MTTSIPSAAEVKAALLPFKEGALKALAEKSGVPFTTLQKIRRGETENPRIETVRQLWPHIGAPAEGGAA